MLVAVQGRGDLAVVDPAAMTVSRRIALPGCDHPHGLALDQAAGAAFVACDGNATLLSVDIATGRVSGTNPVGDGPDVLAYDAALHNASMSPPRVARSPFWIASETNLWSSGRRIWLTGHTSWRSTRPPNAATTPFRRGPTVTRHSSNGLPHHNRHGARSGGASRFARAGVRSVSELVPNRPSMAIDQRSPKETRMRHPSAL